MFASSHNKHIQNNPHHTHSDDSVIIAVFDTKSNGGATRKATNAQDQLQASEKLIAEMNETWEQKLEKTEKIKIERFEFIFRWFTLSPLVISLNLYLKFQL